VLLHKEAVRTVLHLTLNDLSTVVY